MYTYKEKLNLLSVRFAVEKIQKSRDEWVPWKTIKLQSSDE